MNLEDLSLVKISKIHKDKYCIISLIYVVYTYNLHYFSFTGKIHYWIFIEKEKPSINFSA